MWPMQKMVKAVSIVNIKIIALFLRQLPDFCQNWFKNEQNYFYNFVPWAFSSKEGLLALSAPFLRFLRFLRNSPFFYQARVEVPTR
jgi:hypothetical protein